MKLKYNKPNEVIKVDKLNDTRRRYRELKSQERFDKYFGIKGGKNGEDLEYTKLLRRCIREEMY